MRKLFTICLCALIVHGFAQNSTVFQDNMNVIYQHVDRSYVTTGLLLDYGLLLADVAKFDGTLQSSNYINRPLWSMLYTSLYYMKFDNNVTLGAKGQLLYSLSGKLPF